MPKYAPRVPLRPTLIDNRTYDSATMAMTSSSAAAIAANRLYAVPVYNDYDQLIDQLGLLVTIGASGNLRFGAYAPTVAGLPGALIGDAGAVAITAAFKTVAAALTLPRGLSFLAVVSDDTPTVTHGQLMLGLWGNDGGTTYSCVYMAHTYGALPSTFSASPTYQLQNPRVMFRV